LKEDSNDEINKKRLQAFIVGELGKGVEKSNGSGKMLTAVNDGRGAEDSEWRRGAVGRKEGA
jgi:hypothetical protein